MTQLNYLLSTPSGHTDNRRKIIDVTPRVKSFEVFQAVALGNHYHAQTPELFHVTQGEFKIKFDDMKGGRKTYTVKPGNSVQVPLYVAHKVVAQPGTKFINVCDADFDPKADIHPYTIDW